MKGFVLVVYIRISLLSMKIFFKYILSTFNHFVADGRTDYTLVRL